MAQKLVSISELWIKTPEHFEGKQINQVISFIGDGKLRDESSTSSDFRGFLSIIQVELLKTYVEQCLTEKFDGSGFVLQDIINELGRRIGFEVTNGRYRGTSKDIGNDGLWKTPNGHSIIIEVKTTDAYRIDLDSIVKYRQKLIETQGVSSKDSSILIIVGREDTGGLEAQIRGSRHAWDIRVISVEALFRLASIKQEIGNPAIIKKITSILIPQEYTRVDDIIDIVFSTTEDVKEELNIDSTALDIDENADEQQIAPANFNQECVLRIQEHLKISLVKRGKILYSSFNDKIGITCAVSKKHGESQKYWFAFHPHQREALSEYEKAYVCFGCGSEKKVFVIPFSDFRNWLEGQHKTVLEDRFYWHVKIVCVAGEWSLLRKKGLDKISLNKYFIK